MPSHLCFLPRAAPTSFNRISSRPHYQPPRCPEHAQPHACTQARRNVTHEMGFGVQRGTFTLRYTLILNAGQAVDDAFPHSVQSCAVFFQLAEIKCQQGQCDSPRHPEPVEGATSAALGRCFYSDLVFITLNMLRSLMCDTAASINLLNLLQCSAECTGLLTLTWPSILSSGGVITAHHVDTVVTSLESVHLRPSAPWELCLSGITGMHAAAELPVCSQSKMERRTRCFQVWFVFSCLHFNHPK